MNRKSSLLAKEHGLFLRDASDALAAIGSGMRGCVFTEADISDEFFDLRNGIAGDVFQKFVNYGFRTAFVVPEDHKYGVRISELIKDHKRHAFIRFFNTSSDAVKWLREGNN